jgi:hypothetical protein
MDRLEFGKVPPGESAGPTCGQEEDRRSLLTEDELAIEDDDGYEGPDDLEYYHGNQIKDFLAQYGHIKPGHEMTIWATPEERRKNQIGRLERMLKDAKYTVFSLLGIIPNTER